MVGKILLENQLNAISKSLQLTIEKILISLAENHLKWQHCWLQSHALCYVTAQKESNKNF